MTHGARTVSPTASSQAGVEPGLVMPVGDADGGEGQPEAQGADEDDDWQEALRAAAQQEVEE